MHQNLHNKLLIFFIICFFTSCSLTNQPLEIADYQNKQLVLSDKPSLGEYVLYALKNSSALESAFIAYRAALKKAPQVSALPEPVVSYAYFINAIETKVGAMRHRIGISQPVPWFGKLNLKAEIANEEARAAYYAFLVNKNKLVADVIRAYYELAYLKSAQSITDENLELLKRWEQVLSQQYRSQTGSQTDLIKVQVELGKLEDKVKELKDLEEPLRVAFNALLNRPVDSEIKVSMYILSNNPRGQYLKEVPKEILIQHNPEIKLLSALVEAEDKGIHLARKNYYPDFSIGLDYTAIGKREQAGSDGGNDGLAAVFALTLPINFSKYDAALKEAEYKNLASKKILEAKTFQLKSSLAKNIFDISDSKRRISLFAGTLIPKAEEALDSIYTAFESGKASFLDLLDTERELLNFQLMLSRAQADLAIKLSELRALLGDYSEEDLRGKKQ